MADQHYQTVEKSPLDRLLQEDLAPHIGHTADSGCLVLIPAQTGIGKTHSIKQLILTELVEMHTKNLPPRCIYYITNSVDNVRQTYLELQGLIKAQLPKATAETLSAKVLYLPSQDCQLIESDEAKIEQVFQLFDLYSNNNLLKSWQSTLRLKQFIKQNPQARAATQASLEREAADTYRLLISAIQSRQRGNQPLQLSETDMELIDHIIPGEKLQRNAAHVAFMTTSKLLHGYQTLRHRVRPIRELANTLLLIDEFDRQNEVILQFMAEQKALDLIELTSTLHAQLQYHQVEDSSRYTGIGEYFSALKEQLHEFSNRWSMQYAFNTEGTSLADEKVRLFSDRTVIHAHSSQHHFSLHNDAKLCKNIIRSRPKASGLHEGLPNNSLSRFIHEADRAFRQFIWTMKASVWKYQDNIAAEKRTDSASLHEAVHSILRHFNLHDFSDIVFATFDAQASFTAQRESNNLAHTRVGARTYHDNGLKLIDVRLNDGTLDTVGCYFTGLTITPSGLLARLVENGAKVVGISATATSPTVIKNFDLEYLQTRLNHRFIWLSAKQNAVIGDWYRCRRRYAESGVTIEAKFLMEDQKQLIAELTEFNNGPVRKPEMALGALLNREGGSFIIRWVSKLLLAIEGFIASSNNRYMLALLNRTITRPKQPGFIDFLESVLDKLSHQHNASVKLFDGMDAEAMRLGKFEEVLTHLSNTQDKVIVLSTYASMGEGKNPDYQVICTKEKEELIWVGTGKPAENIKTDIDCLYLEKPTNLLLGSNDYQVNQLLLFHQIMSLHEASWISSSSTYSWIKNTLKGLQDKEHLQRYYNTDDSKWLTRRIIEQAVGRTARTAFKRPIIKIYADCELKPLLAGDSRSPANLSLEYLALREEASKEALFTEDKGTLRLHNMATKNTEDTLSLIRDLMSGFRGSRPEFSIRGWEGLRHQLLAAPTLEQQSSAYPRLYLQTAGTEGYWFSGNLDNDRSSHPVSRNLQFFEHATGKSYVSEAESNLPTLMENPVIQAHFVKNNWAQSWLPGSFLMTPAAFNNIYKGALGEESIFAILQGYGLQLHPLPNEVYELCDFLTWPDNNQAPIGIDAKNWQTSNPVEYHEKKMATLNDKTGLRRLAYINLFGKEENACRYLSHELKPVMNKNSSVIEIPGLINQRTGATLLSHLHELIEWINQPDDHDTYQPD